MTSSRGRGRLGFAVGMALLVVVLTGMPIVAADPETYYSFNSSNEGFAKEVNRAWSEVGWDSANGRVSVVSDRQDAADELFTHTTPAFGPSTDFSLRSRWATTQQGNWQIAYPIFLMASGNTQVAAANSIHVVYDSRDSWNPATYPPRYFLRYEDASGILRINVEYVASPNTEYHFFVQYISATHILSMEVRSATDVTLQSASYTIGTNANDGFALGKVGIASHGFSQGLEPAIVGWTDDIRISGTVVSISNVVVDRNSISGATARITWSTSPSSACDSFQWGTTPSYGNTITPPCGTHQVDLSGLSRHVTYYFKITSTSSGYTSGSYASSFYPVDASLSKAYESYSTYFGGTNGCNEWKQVDYTYFTTMPGDLAFDPAKAPNPNNYEIFDTGFHYEAIGQDFGGFCGQARITTRFTTVELWVNDQSGIIDWINAKDPPIFSGYSGNSAGIELGITVGGDLKVFKFGLSAGFRNANILTHKTIYSPCLDQGGGTKYCGSFQVDWPGDLQVFGDIIWPMIITDNFAQYRLWDKVTFTIKWTMTFDTYNHWFHYWYGNNFVVSSTVTIGDGNYNGANILDSFMNVQSGYVTGPET